MPKPKSKVKKIVPFVGMFIAFILASSATFALKTVDAQAGTHCTLTECWTAVDLSKHLATSELNTAKSLDMSKKIPTAISGAKVSKAGNVINITGTIKPGENKYWTMDLSEVGLAIDPWWNYTSGYNDSTLEFSQSWGWQGSNSDFGGVKINALKATNITSIERGAGVDCPYGYVFNSAGTQIAKASFSGDTATFSSPVALTSGQDYYVGVGYDGNTCNAKSLSYGFPVSNSDISVTSGAWWSWTGSFNDDTTMRNMYKIHTRTPTTTSVYYEFSLKLNGTAANLTAQEYIPFNVFAGGNLTALEISLYRNGALVNSAMGNLTESQNLTQGLYNFTAISNNSDVATWWALLTATPIENETNETLPIPNVTIGNYSIIFDIANLEPTSQSCFNESIKSVYYAEPNITRYIVCSYGCEQNECNISPLYQGIAIIIIVIIIFAAVSKSTKKGR